MPFSRLLRAGLAAAALAASPAVAQDAAPYVLPATEVVEMRAEANGVDYAIYVKLPKGYAESQEAYPLLVLLDADYSFAIAANVVEHLSDRGQAPKMIVAAIAYPGVYPDMQAYRETRTRDYTPFNFPTGGYGREMQKLSGGGPAFQSFIADEMIPELAARYRVSGDRTFVGHSYGGLFGAWTLLSRPEIFDRYILVSPSLWYADGRFLSDEAFAEAAPIEQRTLVYMGVGDWENQPETSYAMVDDLVAFSEKLTARGNPDLVAKHRVFEDETHASIFPAVLSTGLRHLFTSMEAGGDAG
jgi:predicted alpha/beta superfamily hydrolase